MKIEYRNHVLESDLQRVREIVKSTGFFYDFEHDVAVELVEDAFNKQEMSDYKFIFAELEGVTVAYACYGKIACTKSGYDLYWIVTHNDYRGKGIGAELLKVVHEAVAQDGGKAIYAETSSMEKYTPTRNFYDKNNYKNVALIPDFYDDGDGKCIFVFSL